MSKTERRQLQHTVRFRTAEEGSLAAMMAASAGVSTSEWVATAARVRMLKWLADGYVDVLSDDVAEEYTQTLEAALEGAAELDDVPVLKRSRASRGVSQRAGL